MTKQELQRMLDDLGPTFAVTRLPYETDDEDDLNFQARVARTVVPRFLVERFYREGKDTIIVLEWAADLSVRETHIRGFPTILKQTDQGVVLGAIHYPTGKPYRFSTITLSEFERQLADQAQGAWSPAAASA